MQSSNSRYLSNLDHLRAFAAYMVFIWHFIHFSAQCPRGQCEGMYDIGVPFLSMLEQGYTGVGLFMCISGYIFTYLTYGRKVHLGKFWLNRILRLLPLVMFWGITESLALIFDLQNPDGRTFEKLCAMAARILHPQGAWTIYIELEYYLALPLLLLALRKFGAKALGIVLAILLINRAILWTMGGTVQEIAYWTILGHADQFVLGSAAFYLERWIVANRPNPKRTLTLLALAGFACIMATYQHIENVGGLRQNTQKPSESVFWMFWPTLEGIGYNLMIIGYLQYRLPKMLDKILSALGRWSYSIYLNHFQFIPYFTYLAVTKMGMGEGFYERIGYATFIVFPMLLPFCALSYAVIEKPFLKLRKSYLS